MKSKPVYAPLELDPTTRRHLLITQGPAGAEAARRAVSAHPGADARTQTLDTGTPLPDAVGVALEGAGMDTALYVAGPEVFVWQVTALLRDAGVPRQRIRQEAAGSRARTVYCVHCRTMNAGVTAATHRCHGCGLRLAVRDHFSRPLAAYLGVAAPAETPEVSP